MADRNESRWQQLLEEAVNQPGRILEAYTAFHGYSLGNRMLALAQCMVRGIQPGPINTYPGWQRVGRQVRRGEKAITLCMPITGKARSKAEPVAGEETEPEHALTRFIFRPNWFVLAQTDGETLPAVPIAAFDVDAALAALEIVREPFEELNGNCQGYARQRAIAVSPIAQLPLKTTFHEIAHVLLGHTAEGALTDSDETPRSLREVEAESVALLCVESLGLPGAEFCRGYIQHWLRGAEIPERSAQRIFKAADQILRAGTEGACQ